MILTFKENRVRRAYYGGKRIDRFAGKSLCEDSRYPEEWIASTVEAFNPDCPVKGEGLSICADGVSFKEILENNTEKILGKRLNDRHDGKLSILVKLLDAAERLVIQCHPTVPFAKEHFGSNFGKTECWYMLDTEPDAHVYLGFKPDVTKEKWQSLFEKQDVEGMLDCLHKFPVKKGELWFVEGGIPHAIGEGCFMIELQEPSDLMVIPERFTPSGVQLADVKLHCGLGFEKMFDCFLYSGADAAETKKRYCRVSQFEKNNVTTVVDSSLTEKFALKCLRVEGETDIDLKDSYAICIVTEGEGTLSGEDETPITLQKSNSFFITANSGRLTFKGNMDIVLCLP